MPWQLWVEVLLAISQLPCKYCVRNDDYNEDLPAGLTSLLQDGNASLTVFAPLDQARPP